MSRLISCILFLGLVACGNDDKKLKVTSIDPDTGDYAAISYAHIYGSHFLTDNNGDKAPANAKIYFGNLQGRITRFVDDGEMVAEVPGAPSGKPETVDVLIIFEGRGEIKIPKGFKFVEKKQGGPSVNDLNTSKPK